MPNSRRNFLKSVGGFAGALTFSSLWDKLYAAEFDSRINKISHLSPEEVATDEDFWAWVQNSYTVSASLVNLNNGGVSPQPKVVQEAFERYNRLSNEAPSFFMWRTLDFSREAVRSDLAAILGCDPEEVAVQRNTTEALANIIFGLPLSKGDEVVLSKHDYPNMINAWKQREKRDGIVLKWVGHEVMSENADELVKRYVDQFSKKTKILHLTHMINWTGQLMPAQRIVEKAHAQGIKVILDAAHTFAHLEFNINEIKADFLGTSLHKWLCAPFGSGMIYVRKEHIPDIWPLMSAPDPQEDNIRKFEHLGTRSFPTEQAIGMAIKFHHTIGGARKEARLRYLKDYWINRAKEIPKVRIHTSQLPEFSGAIGLFSIDGVDSTEIGKILQNDYLIHTTTIIWENIDGVRVTPNVYTSTRELDKLVAAIQKISESN
ncbi:MAG: aminotransferase class V-fold PLP-dependent enzyme [Bacteroidia bacterium]|nr:aminotransferase class V-fold PLP-dependent enzyme [Bacteroidia bacterium]